MNIPEGTNSNGKSKRFPQEGRKGGLAGEGSTSAKARGVRERKTAFASNKFG